ncbi:MAG: hypothetical protein AAED33_05500 [Paracoccaceae bacterium]
MIALMQVLLAEGNRHREVGRSDVEIVFCPDRGHAMLDDTTLNSHPGYPLIGACVDWQNYAAP